MKISVEQLKMQVPKKLAAIYWISGNETLLVQEAAEFIRTAAYQAGFHERKIFHVETGFNWDDLLIETNHLSLFSSQTFLELQIPTNKFSDAVKDFLIAYSQNPPANKILLIKTEKLDTKIQYTAWFKQLEQQIVMVAIWPIDVTQLPRWIANRFQQAGLKTDAAGTQLLAERTEGNLLATQQAIEKLRLLYGSKTISAEEIATAITDNTRFDVFNLVDYALLGDSKHVVHILNILKNESIEPSIILWALTREIRNLIAMAQSLAQGQTFEQTALQYKIWEKRRALIKNVLQRLSIKKLQVLLSQASDIDHIIKGATRGNIWDELLQFSLQLTGIKTI